MKEDDSIEPSKKVQIKVPTPMSYKDRDHISSPVIATPIIIALSPSSDSPSIPTVTTTQVWTTASPTTDSLSVKASTLESPNDSGGTKLLH